MSLKVFIVHFLLNKIKWKISIYQYDILPFCGRFQGIPLSLWPTAPEYQARLHLAKSWVLQIKFDNYY